MCNTTRAEEITGDKLDLVRICKQIMNKAASKRLISKQEAMVLLGQLDLTFCTETIEAVSISNSKQLCTAESSGRSPKTLLSRYKERSAQMEKMSLHDFYHHVQNQGDRSSRGVRIPNFIGVNGTPKFPVTADYAKHVLVCYKPWRTYPTSEDWVGEFNRFINSVDAPTCAVMAYQRVHCRFLSKTLGYEPTAESYDNSKNPIDCSNQELMDLVGLHRSDEYEYDDSIMSRMERGIDYQWDKDAKVSDTVVFQFNCFNTDSKNKKKQKRSLSTTGQTSDPQRWLTDQCTEHEKSGSTKVNIPTHSDGSHFTLERLYDDQFRVVMVVLHKIMEWAECEDYSEFVPLRMTLNGPAGTGKTIVINTLVALIRKLFNDNDVAQVAAPTGVAAFNAGGETLHHMFGNKASVAGYEPFSMLEKKKEKLAAKFKNLLCLIIDERSLLDSSLLGISEQMMSETIFDGSISHESWGKLPVLILVGDDYQLPAVGEGAFKVLDPESGGKSRSKLSGDFVFKECATCVMSLTTSKRIQKDRQADKQLMQKLRLAQDLNKSERKKLLSLKLDTIKQQHGAAAVSEIQNKSIYLFYKNHKRIHKNLELLIQKSCKSNPVAVCKTISQGKKAGKAVKGHFKKTESTNSALLFVGCKVALENRNFNPSWGLHNGAVGTVDEIVFDKGCNPNNGDLPLYVVVDFPLYCGPVWDTANPTVS